jgi:hypothetical protein
MSLGFMLLATVDGCGQGAKHTLEVRGGAAVPTFDFADLVGVGPTFGLGYQFQFPGGVLIMVDVDYSSQPVSEDQTTVKAYHLLGKLGSSLIGEPNPISFILTLGAGVMIFDLEDTISKTHFGTNLGAKFGYDVAPAITLYLNAQADVTFSEVLGLDQTDNAWILPITAGLAYRF